MSEERIRESRADIGAVLRTVEELWRLNGYECLIEFSESWPRGLVATISAGDGEREYLLSSEACSDVWEALKRLPKGGSTRCVVLPRHLLGSAHECLRNHGFLLQGWWVCDGSVGSLEVA